MPFVQRGGRHSLSGMWHRVVFAWVATAAATAHAVMGPVALFTDLTSGPNSGGENGFGAYVTVVGRNFGAARGTSTVEIGGVEVASYALWSDTRLTVQPGPFVTGGNLVVVVNGQRSTAVLPFAVRPGKLFYVALTGSDATGVVGDVLRPFRNVATTFARADFGVGDFLILRGGVWADVETRFDTFFTFSDDKGGTASAPVVLMGYPGENVVVRPPSANLRGVMAYGIVGGVVVANLHLDSNHGGLCLGWPVGASTAPTMQNVRFVNNELYNTLDANPGLSGCVDVRGQHVQVLGNTIHDTAGAAGSRYHAISVDNESGADTVDVEIAYNTIFNHVGGAAIWVTGSGVAQTYDVRVHHNLIHDVSSDGMAFEGQVTTGVAVFDNVMYRSGLTSPGGCLLFNGAGLVATVVNNTLADCALTADPEAGAWRFALAAQVTCANNIVVDPVPSVVVGALPVTLVASDNLWSNAPSFDVRPVTGSADFVDEAAHDFHLRPTSAAVDRGNAVLGALATDDFDGVGRPVGAAYDVGAFEYQAAVTTPDGGSDAGQTSVDSGVDAGAMTADSGPATTDAGDAGGPGDGVDAALPSDAGGLGDAGVTSDGGDMGDAAVPSDAGSEGGAGLPADAGASAHRFVIGCELAPTSAAVWVAVVAVALARRRRSFRTRGC